MSERIERKDLISDEALQAIVDLAAKLEIAQTNLKELINQARALNKQMTAATGIKEMNKQTVEAAKLQNKLNIESAKYANDLKKLEVAAQRTALAAEKAAVAQKKHNDTLNKAKENTNTWGKALGSFQFKFNALGNAAAMVGGKLLGLGGIITKHLVGAFTSWFTKTDEGMEFMERKIAGLKAAWNVFSQEVSKGSDKVAESIDNMNTKLSEAEQGMGFWAKALGILSAFSSEGGAQFADIGKKMDVASIEAEKFTAALQDIEDAEIANISVRAKANLELAKARQLSIDETKSINERVDALQNAISIENKVADKENEINEDRITALEAMKTTYKDFWTDSHEKILQEALAKRYSLETDSLGRTRRAESTLSKFRAELEKEYTDNLKKETTERNKIIKDWNELRIKLAKDTAETEEKINADFFNSVSDDLEKLSEIAAEEYDKGADALKNWSDEEIKFMTNALKAAETLKDISEQRIEYEKYAADIALQLSDSLKEKEESDLNAKYDRDIAYAEKTIKDEEALNARKIKLTEDYEKKQKAIRKKYAIVQGMIDIAVVWAKAAAAKAMANASAAPYLVNPLTAAIVGPMLAGALLNITRSAIAQTAAIGVQTGLIAGFAKGTDSSPEGLAWVGEKGRELMIDRRGNVGFSPDKAALTYLEKGTKIIPADLTERMMMGSKRRPNDRQQNEMIPYLDKLVNKPVTSVNIDNTGISVMTETSATLTKRIDKYFRS